MKQLQGNYQERLQAAEEIVIEAISQTMDLYGVTPSIGRLYGVLYFAEGPLSLDEMSEKLGMSKPSMSTSIRTLQQVNMVHKVWQKGNRKDQYQAEKDFFKSFVSFFCSKWNREIQVNVDKLTDAQNLLEALTDDPAVPSSIQEKAQQDLAQLEASREYYEWLKKLVSIFESKEMIKWVERGAGRGPNEDDI